VFVFRELLPVAFGLGAGTVLAGLRPALSIPVAALLSVILGFAATVITGEFELGWEYLLIDIPLVAVSAVTGFWFIRALRLRSPLSRGDGDWR